jgi:hypothetical protein
MPKNEYILLALSTTLFLTGINTCVPIVYVFCYLKSHKTLKNQLKSVTQSWLAV